jgi:hypothetical protein
VKVQAAERRKKQREERQAARDARHSQNEGKQSEQRQELTFLCMSARLVYSIGDVILYCFFSFLPSV